MKVNRAERGGALIRLFAALLIVMMIPAGCTTTQGNGGGGTDSSESSTDSGTKEVKNQYGALAEFSYSPGYSDMMGGYYREGIRPGDDGKPVYFVTECEDHSAPERTGIFEMPEDALEVLQEIIDRYNLTELENRKESDEFVYDYSPWSYHFTFEKRAFGKTKRSSVSFDEYRRYRKSDLAHLEEFLEAARGMRGELIATLDENGDIVAENNPSQDDVSTGQSDTGQKPGGNPPATHTVTRKDAYQNVLELYKEAQDGSYTMEQLEQSGLHTELAQRNWPDAASGNEVRYLYFDMDADGADELIITYNGDLQDIYAFDGTAAKLVYSTPVNGSATLYPDGMVKLLYSFGYAEGIETWSQYDAGLCGMFDVFEHHYGMEGDFYYTFSYYDMEESVYQNVMKIFEESGSYPVWMGEWSGELTKDEYESILPKTSPVRLPQGETL